MDEEGSRRIAELNLTREWFAGAAVFDDSRELRVIVQIDTAADPLYPPVGESSPDEDDEGPQFMGGWGFAFFFSDRVVESGSD